MSRCVSDRQGLHLTPSIRCMAPGETGDFIAVALQMMHEIHASVHTSSHQRSKAGGLCMLNLADMAPWCVGKVADDCSLRRIRAKAHVCVSLCRLPSFQIADWQSDSTVKHFPPGKNRAAIGTYHCRTDNRQQTNGLSMQRSPTLCTVSCRPSSQIRDRFQSRPVHRDLGQRLAIYGTHHCNVASMCSAHRCHWLMQA